MRSGTLVLACTTYGFWMRARVESVAAGLTQIRYVEDEGTPWLPKLNGVLDGEVVRVPPERLASLPDAVPRSLPSAGTTVLALWDRKRFHKGQVVRHEARRGVVRFDEGDELDFSASDLLPCGEAPAAAIAGLRARGLEIGRAVTTVDASGARADAFVAELGSGQVYVRWSGISYGRWISPEQLTLGGRGRRREPTASHRAAPGAKARVRWLDREHYDAVILAVDPSEIRIRYDDGTEQTVAPSRVIAISEAPRPIPQASEKETFPSLVTGSEVLAEDASGTFHAGVVRALRGAQVLVAPDEGEPFWAWGLRLAVPLPDRARFPVRGTAVVVVTEREQRGRRKKGKGKATQLARRPGRVGHRVGDRVSVRFADGGAGTATLDSLWLRGEALRGEKGEAVPSGLADVERDPDRWAEATLEGTTEEGMVRVTFTSDRRRAAVDRTRIRLRPAPAPAPAPAKVAAKVEAKVAAASAPSIEPLVEDADRVTTFLRGLAAEWGSGGYRGDALASMRLDETAILLPVDRGTLVVRVAGGSIAITADRGASEVLPPIEAPLVRFASWFTRVLGGPAADARATEDEAWATSIRSGARVGRAGGALTLSVALEGTRPEEVARWARVVHARVVAPAGEE